MEQKRYRPRLEILQGTLDMLILQTLQWGPTHGYAIGQTIRTESAESLKIETGSLYPALQKLLVKGWVKAAWRESESGRQVREYRLTASGRRQLDAEMAEYRRTASAIGVLLDEA